MARGVPLDPTVIEQIRQLAAAGLSRDGIARQLGVSRWSVTKYAPAGSFDRSATAAAVKAHKIDAAAVRTQLALDLISDAARLREQMWQPTKIYNFGGKDNTYNEMKVDQPPFDSQRTIMLAANTALQAHLRLVDYDSNDGMTEALSLFDGFIADIRNEQP